MSTRKNNQESNQNDSKNIIEPMIKPKNMSQNNALNALNDESLSYHFLTGSAGSGKTLLAVLYAIKKFVNKEYKKIVVTRPAVNLDEEHGFLPGPQPLYSKVLTSNGWKTMEEMVIGEEVITVDGQTSIIENIYPQGVKDVYEVKTSYGKRAHVCGDHVWEVSTNNEENVIKSTNQIKELIKNQHVYLPTISYNKIKYKNNFDIMNTLSHMVIAHFKDVNISIKHNQINEHSFVKDNISHISFDQYNGRINYYENQNGLMVIFDDYEYKIKDFIEKIILTSNIETKLYIIKQIEKTFGDINKELIIQSSYVMKFIQWMMFSMGYSVDIQTNNDYYTINVNRDPDRDYIQSIEYVKQEQVQCISIDDDRNLYITDDFIPTHNTLEEKMHPWMLPIFDILSEFFDSQTLKSYIENGNIEIAPLAYMRGRNLGPIIMDDNQEDQRGYIIIADEMQNSTEEQMKMLLTRIGHNSKMIITGDPSQHDRDMDSNGLIDIIQKLRYKKINSCSLHEFNDQEVQRSKAVKDILNVYSEGNKENH
ncbi:PhoH-like protein [Salicola phage SCTP-2]|nr:PhoH-like protein [Salicola phage SCTP-2]